MSQTQRTKLNALAARAAARKAAPQSPALPHIVPHPEKRHEPFPLSDMQQAYWIGRSADLRGGGVAMQSCIEIDCPSLDVARFEIALNALVERHDMLRAVVTPEGLQRVLPLPVHFPLTLNDLIGLDPAEQQRRLDELADRLSAQVSDLSVWPQSEVHFSLLGRNPDGNCRGVLHFRWDMWAMDGRSFQILYEDLAALYLDPETKLPELPVSFRDYMLALHEFEQSEVYTNSMEFWRERLRTLPPAPDFPKPLEDVPENNAIKRYEAVLTEAETSAIQSACARHGVSLTALLAAVYGEVIAFWSNSGRFTLNMPRFNRNLHWHEAINHVVGEFATFTLVPVDTISGVNIVDRAAGLQKTLWENLERAEISGVRLLRELARTRGALEAEAMPVVFTAMPDRRADDDGMEKVLEAFGRVRRTHGSTPQTKLDCQYTMFTDKLHIYWDGKTSAFPPGMIDAMFDEYLRVLHLLAHDPAAWTQSRLAALPLEQEAVRSALNNRPMPLPEGTACDLILELAASSPENPAIIAPDRSLNYGEVLQYANLVRVRVSEAVQKTDSELITVALVMERGWQSVVCALGIQLAGLPYLPLDPGNPAPRLQGMLRTGRAALAISQTRLREKMDGVPLPVVYAEELFSEPLPETKAPVSRLDMSTLPAQADPAYVMLTSGTTGTPKAVVVSHLNVLNLIVYTNNRFSMRPDDRLLGVTSMHHDLSVYDIFGALTSGAALVTLPQDEAMQPDVWIDTVLRHRVTFWNSVPAFITAFVERANERNETLPIRVFVAGGDWVEANLPDKARRVAPDITFYSIGGPTETTVWNIMYQTGTLPDGWKSIPYGEPISNNSYHILDADLRDVPDWVNGEMYCGGANVCLDILSEDNEQRFFTHPKTGERLYRTGDAGRYHADGLIEILGRTDFQINIGGYRLDPAEIEAALADHPLVDRAVVIPTGSGAGKAASALGAFICANDTSADEKVLREWLGERLPLPMMPRLWWFVTELPLTSNGKVDRRALMELAERHDGNAEETVAAPDRAPQTPVEQLLAALWQDVLHTDIPGVQANFFRLGGDSLKAVQILGRLKEKLPVPLPLSAFFATPTIEGLAEALITLISARMSHAAGDTAR